MLLLLLLAGFTVTQSQISAASDMVCTLTGKKIATWCCEQKGWEALLSAREESDREVLL
jgi:hypothetical protein